MIILTTIKTSKKIPENTDGMTFNKPEKTGQVFGKDMQAYSLFQQLGCET